MDPKFPNDLAKQASRANLRRALLLGGSAVTLILVAALMWPLLWPHDAHQSASSALLLTATPSPFLPSGTPSATATPDPAQAASANSVALSDTFAGTMIVSMTEQGHAQVFWVQLAGDPFTRLTSGAWDDIDPAVSPDGSRLAFASNRGGDWDLYTLDLTSGATTQLSDDAGFDGNPSWSADGSWIAYEHFEGDDLEIYMRPLDGSIEPVALSAHPAADYAPAWRLGAQQIAFISRRAGQAQIWLVDLEADGDGRFRPLVLADAPQADPAWSADGEWLAWSQQDDGVWTIYAADIANNGAPARLGIGESPQWNPAGNAVLVTVRTANDSYLTAYTPQGGLALALMELPAHAEGIAWSSATLAHPLAAPLNAAAIATPRSAWADALAGAAGASGVVDLVDVNAPVEELSDAAAEPFAALRQRAALLLGWDALSSLENAYTPISEPLPPARQQDWLYTGRAFELHSALLSAGWMQLVCEEYEGQTYWRVFLRTADESGGLGRPLTELPWNIAARYTSGDAALNAGGQPGEELPAGYWVDFTALAVDYGFERLPALPNWRSYYQGALFNQFVLTARLSWEQAMLQLYSAEEVATVKAARP
jgi:TolB protein